MAEPAALPAPAEPASRLSLPPALDAPLALLRANPLLARAAWPIIGASVAAVVARAFFQVTMERGSSS